MSLYLLDTNIISELARKYPNSKVIAFVESLDEITISSITVEEIDFGINRVNEKTGVVLLKWWDSFLSIPPHVIAIDENIARIAGGIRASLEKSGKQITQADALIAASALSTGRILVTRNIKDFVDCGVKLYNPFQST